MYHIPLSHPVLDDHGVYYQSVLKSNLCFDIKLSPASKVVVTSDNAKGHTYELTDIELEYATIDNTNLTFQAAAAYQSGRTFYFEDVHRFMVHPSINISSGATMNFHINTPRSCMKGILLLFLKSFDSGERDSEEFVNPFLDSVKVSINGVRHKLFSDGFLREDSWPMMLKRFDQVGEHFKEIDFQNDKHGLWIDLRSTPDNNLHGDGVVVGRSQDLTQQLTSIAKPIRENLGCIVAFHNPEVDGTDLLFQTFGSGIDNETKKKICKI